jgi:hypothetical protein
VAITPSRLRAAARDRATPRMCNSLKQIAALIEQLRAGYAEMDARRMGGLKQLATGVSANSETKGAV